MRRGFCKIWISVVGIAVVTSVAGCGGHDAPGAPGASSVAAPSPSSPPVDVDAAFAQFVEAVKPFWCSTAYFDIGEMLNAGDVDTMKVRVHEYRDTVTTWHDQVGKISFPPAAQPIVDKIRELDLDELNDLNALAAAVEKNDKKQMNRLTGLFYFNDALVSVEVDRLSAALGHPEPQAGIAFNQLELAYQTFYQEQAPVGDMFEAALSRNDLNGAKAANAIEEDALQRYIDRLDAIDWPAQFEGQVNVLRDNLRGGIEFDRRQVDVATAAQVVRAPDEGIPEARAAREVKGSLHDGLAKLADESDANFKC